MTRQLGIAVLTLVVCGLALNADHKPDPKIKITKTDSGLQYQDLKVGEGDAAKKGDNVEVHYTGWLAEDGTKFDSSVDRKRTFEFSVGAGRVIKGWDEGIVGMKVGGKRKLIIPAKLAYGETKRGKIPPNSDLVFDVELIRVINDHKPEPKVKIAKSESGLQYQDLKEGKGDAVKKGDIAEVHYTGRLAKGGKKFDSSIGKAPIEFAVGAGRVIKGWDEGLIGLKVGGKRKLIVPAKLAYGEKEIEDVIPANSDLVFDVELVRIVNDHKPASGVKITKTDSGLQYQDLKEGNGAAVKKGDKVTVHYTGRLAKDGKKFDSSIGDDPIEVTVGAGRVIKGWDEGLIGLKVGGKRKLIIPAKLAYGEKEIEGVIPANSDLVFDIELVEIKKSE